MRTYDIIKKKRDGYGLEEAELEFLVRGVSDGSIPDYQTAAFLMAAYLRGLSREETIALTRAMIHSGEVLDLSSVSGIKVDKHSTGGVGDKTTLIAGPLVAAAGVPVAKMSGRALGHTGGTIDKLESIPGLRTDLAPGKFVEQVRLIGLAVSGHSSSLVPADQSLYALRDATATVESPGLIAASVLSKKIAGGADAIVLDVKAGEGAFAATLEEARSLAHLLVELGRSFERRVVALVTAMDEPLGLAVGNSLEVVEAIKTLQGDGPPDLTALSVALAGQMLYLGGVARDSRAGEELAAEQLARGRALAKFREMVEAQGGDGRVVEDTSLLPAAPLRQEVRAGTPGWVSRVSAMTVGRAAGLAGAGRQVKGEKIDPAAGVELCRKTGDRVKAGEVLAVLHGSRVDKLTVAAAVLEEAFTVAESLPASRPLIYDLIQ